MPPFPKTQPFIKPALGNQLMKIRPTCDRKNLSNYLSINQLVYFCPRRNSKNRANTLVIILLQWWKFSFGKIVGLHYGLHIYA